MDLNLCDWSQVESNLFLYLYQQDTLLCQCLTGIKWRLLLNEWIEVLTCHIHERSVKRHRTWQLAKVQLAETSSNKNYLGEVEKE